MEPANHTAVLEIRLLGSLRVLRDGQGVDLPRSRRTRALLGYLVATGASHSRERLCDLLWDGPDDPRAALRWGLAKLRPLLDDRAGPRLIAEGDRIAFRCADARIDLLELQALQQPGLGALDIEALERARDLLAEEFLDGLDLPACARFHHWCIGERERLGVLRAAVLGMMIEKVRGEPGRAIVYARQLAAAEPLSEGGHAAVVAALGALGHRREAQEYGARARAMLIKELCAPLSGQLDEALLALGRRPARDEAVSRPVEPEPAEFGRQARAPRYIERGAVQRILEEGIEALLGTHPQPATLVVGEPGIGKTCLLNELARRAAASGCRVLYGRSFEAERARPYGPWIDAMSSASEAGTTSLGEARAVLSGPRPAGGAFDSGKRGQLFECVASLLSRSVSETPTVLAMDDVQWLDEASAALLHHLVRSTGRQGRLWVVLAARGGELDENRTMALAHRSLLRENRLREVRIEALDLQQTAALIESLGEGLDAEALYRASKGNPLFALELARARLSGVARPEASLEALIASELARLDETMRDLVEVAAAFGRDVPSELLELAGEGQPRLSVTLEALERRGVLRENAKGHYDFGHDLVRGVAYRAQSQARRRLVHRRIARALEELARADESLYGDMVHHALAGGDPLGAARAAVRASDRCLRVCANADAAALAARGLDGVERLPPGGERTALRVALLRALAMASVQPGTDVAARLAHRLREVAEEARAEGMHAAEVDSLYMLSWLKQMAGDAMGTREATLDAAQASRAGDAVTRCAQLANTARCLLEVEADRSSAGTLLDEARAIAGDLQRTFTELHWAEALLHRWDGRPGEAYAAIGRALDHARRREERWREYQCLACRGVMELEAGWTARADATASELAEAARRMGEGAAPFATALRAAARRIGNAASIDSDRRDELEVAEALGQLRRIDDKAHLAFLLNRLADFDLLHDRPEQALLRASEARAAAGKVHRPCEEAIAICLCASACLAKGGSIDGERDLIDRIEALGKLPAADLDARARAALSRVTRLLERITTPLTTGSRVP